VLLRKAVFLVPSLDITATDPTAPSLVFNGGGTVAPSTFTSGQHMISTPVKFKSEVMVTTTYPTLFDFQRG
jgi:hypothetical protein